MPDQQPIGSGLTEQKYQDVLKALLNESSALKPMLKGLHPADLADFLERLPQDQREKAFSVLPDDVQAATLAELGEGAQSHLLASMDIHQIGAALQELDSDDAVDIVQHLDEERVSDVVRQLDKEEKRLVRYDENTAGGLMSLDVVSFPKSKTVGEVLTYFRDESENLPKDMPAVFVVEKDDKLVGKLRLSDLVRAVPSKRLAQIMEEDPVKVTTDVESAEVVSLFEKYDIYTCPVVTKRGKLIGRISVDDVLDVMAQDIAHSYMRQSGVSEKDDLFAPVSQTTRQRFPWLLVNLFTAILASAVIAMFEAQIDQLVALAVLMPIVASMGGNAAGQTLTVTVRGLATKRITMQNAFSLLWKEVAVGTFNGLLLALCLAVGTVLFYDNVALGAVIFAATVANHLFAALAGHMIPIILEKLNKDPAISSGVLVTTVTDVCGFFVFLGLAAIFLL